MDKKNRIYIIITGAAAITLIWLSQSNQNSELNLELPIGNSIANDTTAEPVNTLEGNLWSSDDETKGNLMLVTGDTTIYVRTSRDFSELVGKNVVVSIDGTLDNFTLLNIEENFVKDGYIKVE